MRLPPHSIPIEQLDKPVIMTFRYNPRGGLEEDPAPWQLIVRTGSDA